MRRPSALNTLQGLQAGRGVVGFGISNDERLGEPDTFITESRIARDAGLLVVPHAGFYTGHFHVRQWAKTTWGAQDWTRNHRSAESGYARDVNTWTGGDGNLPDFLRPARGTFVIGAGSRHQLQQAGVRVALGVHDPLIFGTRLVGHYDNICGIRGLDDPALAELARQAVFASTSPEEERCSFSRVSRSGSISTPTCPISFGPSAAVCWSQ
jgi:adenosine deaminase